MRLITPCIGHFTKAGEKEVQMAIDAAMKAHKEWSELPWVERASVMLRVAELLSTKYRYILNASVMLGQSKNRSRQKSTLLAN